MWWQWLLVFLTVYAAAVVWLFCDGAVTQAGKPVRRPVEGRRVWVPVAGRLEEKGWPLGREEGVEWWMEQRYESGNGVGHASRTLTRQWQLWDSPRQQLQQKLEGRRW